MQKLPPRESNVKFEELTAVHLEILEHEITEDGRKYKHLQSPESKCQNLGLTKGTCPVVLQSAIVRRNTIDGKTFS